MAQTVATVGVIVILLRLPDRLPLYGPVRLLSADEINRTPPKTQAALLEAMQEQTVTVSGRTYQLDEPFLVLATQNPIEQEGHIRFPRRSSRRVRYLRTVPGE